MCQEECQSCTQKICLSRYWSVYDVCTYIETCVFLHQLWLWMYTNTCSWIYWKSLNWPTCFRIVSGLSQNATKTQTKRSQNARRTLPAIQIAEWQSAASTSVSMTQNATPKRSQSVRLSAALLQNATQNANPKRKAKHAKSFFVRGLPNLNRKLVSVRGCRKKQCLLSE